MSGPASAVADVVIEAIAEYRGLHELKETGRQYPAVSFRLEGQVLFDFLHR